MTPLYKSYNIVKKLKEDGKNCYDFEIKDKYRRVLKFYGFEKCEK